MKKYIKLLVSYLLITSCVLHAGELQQDIIDIAVIGSGAAGLTAALYGSRAQVSTKVFAGNEPGGQLMGSSLVENIPGVVPQPGYKVIQQLEEQAVEAGAAIMYETIVACEVQRDGTFMLTTEQSNHYQARSVIIATGANARLLKVPGETAYYGNGVYTCAVCDCRAARDKDVLVIGGGDAAIESVMHIAPYARSIKILVRKHEMRAQSALQNKIKKYDTVEVLYQHEVTEILGDGKNIVGVKIAVNGTVQEQILPCQAIYLAIGHTPAIEVFKDLVTINEHGCIHVQDRTQKTNVPGLFAAGDVTDHMYRQATVAQSDGAKAALDAIAYIHARA